MQQKVILLIKSSFVLDYQWCTFCSSASLIYISLHLCTMIMWNHLLKMLANENRNTQPFVTHLCVRNITDSCAECKSVALTYTCNDWKNVSVVVSVHSRGLSVSEVEEFQGWVWLERYVSRGLAESGFSPLLQTQWPAELTQNNKGDQ